MKYLTIVLLAVSLMACGNADNSGAKKTNTSKSKAANSSGLTDFQLKNGIGPVTEEITLADAIDQNLVKAGKEVFEINCSACHKISERYVGPEVDEILTRRTPTYVMNMILNPEEMIKKHPEGKKMFAQYLTPMPKQNVTVDDARAIVEYFRTVQK